MQIKVTTATEQSQKKERPYNRLTVIYDENSATSKHKKLWRLSGVIQKLPGQEEEVEGGSL